MTFPTYIATVLMSMKLEEKAKQKRKDLKNIQHLAEEGTHNCTDHVGGFSGCIQVEGSGSWHCVTLLYILQALALVRLPFTAALLRFHWKQPAAPCH
jgi:hypothetical protein